MSRSAQNGNGRHLAADDLDLLFRVLPTDLQAAARALPRDELLELVLDLGRLAEARYPSGARALSDHAIRREHLDHVVRLVGEFTEENRAGVERTLHRISAIRNRKGEVVGLTLRVGRAVYGTIDVVRDLVESGRSILLVGPPGVGKTTKLREMSRIMADDLRRRVMVVDTSNEIGGDGDVPHPGIGTARRMQVARPDRQHAVMIEAVENHMPEVVVVDEIGTEAEALAARTIAERGVQLVATAHGNTLENLVLNPSLSDLVGGVATVTLGDEEARARGTPKTIRERRAPPTFEILLELVGRDELIVHADAADAVDRLLAGKEVGGERRQVRDDGSIASEHVAVTAQLPTRPQPPAPRRGGATRIYGHGVSPKLIDRVLRQMDAEARVVGRPEEADVILALRGASGEGRIRRQVEQRRVQLFNLKRVTSAQVRRVLRRALGVAEGLDEDEVRDAVEEAEHAIQRVLLEGAEVALAPRRPSLRRVQHQMVSRYRLLAESVGSDPWRHLVIRPPGASSEASS